MKTMSGCRVFIGHLSNRASERDVEHFFERFGKIVEVSLKTGYGFVEFEDSRDADDAVYELNNRSLCGQRVTVEIAKGVKRDQSNYGGGLGGKYYGRSSDRHSGAYERSRDTSSNYSYNRSRNVHYGGSSRYQRLPQSSNRKYRVIIKNLSSKCHGQELKNYMREGGDVTYAEAHHKVKYEGMVDFASYSDMKRAINKLDHTELFGRRIQVLEDRSSSLSQSRSRSPRQSRSQSRDRNRNYSRSRSPNYRY